MKLDNISFSSPKIICVSRDITCGCPYDIHGIALLQFAALRSQLFDVFIENWDVVKYFL